MPAARPTRHDVGAPDRVALPTPRQASGLSVEAAISARRSIREFAAGAVSLAELGQLLWAAQGVTGAAGGRAAPSAGATYPLELYAATGPVDDLAPGLYRYVPKQHELRLIEAGDVRRPIAEAALSQTWIAEAVVILVIAAVFERTTGKYGHRGERYVQIEAGHASENACLQAVALGLGSTVVGAFDDGAVRAILGGDHAPEPLCLLPVGRL